MLMFLGGEGGTGKSAVLRALTMLMSSLGIRNRLRIGAQTGVAAGNVDGSTLHTLLDLMDMKRGKGPRDISDKVVGNFKNVGFFFVDEFPMSGGCMVHTLSTKLSDALSSNEPFGGLDMIFTGDFYQLPPTTNDPLYRYPDPSASVNLSNASKGIIKFKELTHVIILRQQHRMKDKVYKDFVTRFRHGNCTQSDQQYCKTKVIDGRNNLAKGPLSKLEKEPTIIVTGNERRYHINMYKAKQAAENLGEKLLINIAKDTCTKQKLDILTRREFLLHFECGKTSYGAGLLPMYTGMPIMMKKNVGTELGVSNGSTGTIHHILLNSREQIDYTNLKPHYLRYHPIAVYVKLDVKKDQQNKDEIKFHLPGLPPNVFQLSTSLPEKSFPMMVDLIPSHLSHTISVKRTQFKFLPAFAITVYSSQGRTMDSAIVCLDGSFKFNAKPYVMLSRLTNGTNLGILGTWSRSLWNIKPDPLIVSYLDDAIYPKENATRDRVPRERALSHVMETQLREKARSMLNENRLV